MIITVYPGNIYKNGFVAFGRCLFQSNMLEPSSPGIFSEHYRKNFLGGGHASISWHTVYILYVLHFLERIMNRTHCFIACPLCTREETKIDHLYIFQVTVSCGNFMVLRLHQLWLLKIQCNVCFPFLARYRSSYTAIFLGVEGQL